MSKKCIVLLSGGLDSFVALDIAQKNYDVVSAFNFNYGQLAFAEENEAAKNIAKFYNIELKSINLPYLSNISNNALTNLDNNNDNEIKEVWIPNRNGLFLNIGACYCDKFDIDFIIIGANKEEAKDFSDNSEDFIEAINNSFLYSTQKHPKVLAPCIRLNKVDMINYAIENNLPLNIIKSCYRPKSDNKSHCGKCMSCRLLYNAILASKKPELVKEIF